MAEAQAMIQAVQQAATAAAEAAQALRAVGAPKPSGFAEANKLIDSCKRNSILFPHATSGLWFFCILILVFKKPNSENTNHDTHTHF